MDNILQELSDIKAIENLMVHYADRIDAKDAEGAAACFTEDGIGHYWGDYKGRKEIAECLTTILQMFKHTSHHLSNMNINLNGNRATAKSYVYAFHRMAASNKPMHFWGRWVDRLVKINNNWYFEEREVVTIDSIGLINME